MKKVVLLILCLSIITVLCGCETLKGFCKDVQNTGDNLWELITKTK